MLQNSCNQHFVLQRVLQGSGLDLIQQIARALQMSSFGLFGNFDTTQAMYIPEIRYLQNVYLLVLTYLRMVLGIQTNNQLGSSKEYFTIKIRSNQTQNKQFLVLTYDYFMHTVQNWYFGTKIVLTYCEKKLFQ